VRGSPGRAAELRERGLRNARMYPWERLGRAMVEAVETRIGPEGRR
jgi:hypothetical protein